MLLNSLESDFYSKLNSRKRENSLSVFHRNSPKYSNDQRGELDSNVTARETQDYAPLQRQATNNQKSLTTSKHSIEFTYSDFPCHFKVNRDKLALPNRRWMRKKRQKIDDYFQEQNSGSEEKIRTSWTSDVRMISQSNLRI